MTRNEINRLMLIAAAPAVFLFCGQSGVAQGGEAEITAWHDNTMENPNNPDPEQWVGWGDRTVDEMAHARVDVTYLEQEDYETLVAERAADK